MSEYMEKHAVSRLIGAPPGYVGYDEGGQLTEASAPQAVLGGAVDEIEKAHPDVFNSLLQILEEGRLTDSQGPLGGLQEHRADHDLQPGTQDLRKATLGFARADKTVSYEAWKEKVTDALKKHFRPEFLNRVDEVIVFHELSPEEVTQIVDLMIRRVADQLAGQGMGPRDHPGGQDPAGRGGLRPDARGAPAAPGHPAHGGGSPVRTASAP